MKTWPSDPIRQNDRLIAAFCDDLFDRCVTGSDPKSRDRRERTERLREVLRKHGERA